MNTIFKVLTTVSITFMLSISLYAQKDVTTFLGIPVDGYKSEMIQKLKNKGFTISSSNKDVLVGEFNGMDVNIHIATNNNKVCRIMVCDANTMNEADIRIRFNKLCQQFKGNKKYLSLSDYTIPEDEDISYEMTVNSKRYDALFYQQTTEELDSKELQNFILEKYTKEQLSNLTEEERRDIAIQYYSYKLTQKAVWFTISEYYGKYYITMFYDNEYNRANGEDL